MKRILVVAAHPDDEVLGCGATIAKEIGLGSKVRTLILAQGITVRYEDKNDPKAKKELEMLYEDARKANSILGGSDDDIVFEDFPCSDLNTVPFSELRKRVTQEVQSFKPDEMYIHHFGDYNPDHEMAFKAALFASRPYAGQHYPKAVYSFEVLSSTEWAYQPKFAFTPNVFVDVTDTIKKKMEAMQAYRSEVKAYPFPRSPEAIEALARKRGTEANMKFAEAFELVRLLKA